MLKVLSHGPGLLRPLGREVPGGRGGGDTAEDAAGDAAPSLAARPSQQCPQVRRYFDKADKDGNGKLTKEEWYDVLNNSGVPTSP